MRFRSIDFGKMLYETLRGYFSVNSSGELSILYTFLACVVSPIIQPFNTYAAERVINGLVANCKWQMGQVANVLNYLFDDVSNSIYIIQSSQNQINATTFAQTAIAQAGTFGNYPLQLRTFNDKSDQGIVQIHIPNYVSLPPIIAIVNQIILAGIPYEIVTFIPIS